METHVYTFPQYYISIWPFQKFCNNLNITYKLGMLAQFHLLWWHRQKDPKFKAILGYIAS